MTCGFLQPTPEPLRGTHRLWDPRLRCKPRTNPTQPPIPPIQYLVAWHQYINHQDCGLWDRGPEGIAMDGESGLYGRGDPDWP